MMPAEPSGVRPSLHADVTVTRGERRIAAAFDVVPGLKSPVKIRALFESLRAPCRELLRACA